MSLFGNTYCKADLVEMLPEGAKVRVRYDLHSADQVWLLTMDGMYLGEARWDSHREAAFPVPMMDQLRAERAAGKVRRGEKIIAEAQAELGQVLDFVPAEPMPAIDLASAISDAELAEMEARRPAAPTLPDLLDLADASPAPAPSSTPAPRDFMDMAMWLAGDDLYKDAAGNDAQKDSAAG